MKERPILFSSSMVLALLAGTKTQTRRLVKLPPASSLRGDWEPMVVGGPGVITSLGEPVAQRAAIGHTGIGSVVVCPHGQPGDRLLVSMEIPSSPNDDYCAGSDGRVYSRTRYAGFGRKDRVDWYPLVGAIAKQKGYVRVSLCHENKKVTRSVHSLICEAFYGPPPFNGAQVRHLNGNPSDNGPENLCWGTQEENWADRKAQGRGCEGEKHHAAKLSDEDRSHVRWAVERNLCSQRHAARALGMSQGSICQLIRGAELVSVESVIPARIPRISLEVTNVRVERLQDIGESDAIAEGIPVALDNDGEVLRSQRWAIQDYRSLWESINGAGSWSANPWVWAISFKRLP